MRLKIYKKQEAVSTQCNEESKQPRRALVMIVMYIAAKTCSPDPSSRYLIDWGNSSRKADRAEKFTSQCDSSWAGHARSIARITRRFISGHMVRSRDAARRRCRSSKVVSPAVVATTLQCLAVFCRRCLQQCNPATGQLQAATGQLQCCDGPIAPRCNGPIAMLRRANCATFRMM